MAEEWFGPWKINEAGDGSFTVEVDYPENDWLYGFILSFGDKAEVISPDKVREQLHRIASGIVRCYGPSFSSNSSTQR
ncbi:hypothetical protein J2TS4_37320 [Paenibacillus sp. J2TS4]|nr:hypothetical protein J2TS4_37320 [Paenibacillus sp. J2TS4]